MRKLLQGTTYKQNFGSHLTEKKEPGSCNPTDKINQVPRQPQQKAVFSSIGTERDEGGVAASAAAYFLFLQKHPEIAHMFALVSFDGEFESGITERDLQTSGIAFVKSLQNSGAVRDDIGADMMLAAFASLIEHWFISRERFAKLNDLEPGPSLDARYFDVVLKILNGGVQISKK